MLLVDANVLLHAVNESSRDHAAARNWLRDALQGGEAVAFAWTVVLAFLRLSTHRAVFDHPLRVDEAGDLVERWLSAPPAVSIEPTGRHLPLLRGLLGHAGTAGNLVGDAHLAALALEHGATVVSFDRDFARFHGVRLRRPDSPTDPPIQPKG
ncbi:MAG: PIN domain-containing protein [Actinomycetota bacterium]|nr:PIN domain-containing protein [Actinomycetota bacterium]